MTSSFLWLGSSFLWLGSGRQTSTKNKNRKKRNTATSLLPASFFVGMEMSPPVLASRFVVLEISSPFDYILVQVKFTRGKLSNRANFSSRGTFSRAKYSIEHFSRYFQFLLLFNCFYCFNSKNWK